MTDGAGPHTIAERVESVRRRIEAAAGGRPVILVAVAKGHPADHVLAARAAGVEDFGENYASELLGKAAAVRRQGSDACRWHFLGAVQRRKVAGLAPVVSSWQSVDRLAAGAEIARRAPGARVFVQVDATGRPGRNGCAIDGVAALVGGLCDLGLEVTGLMTVPDPAAAGATYRQVARLGRNLGLPELSMGMSDDLEVAVAEGSTMVRVGRALFGPRPGPEDLRRYPHPEGGW